MKRMLTIVLVLSIGASLSFAEGVNEQGGSQGESFPSRPVRCIVPWAAGGGTDTLIRALTVSAEEHLGQPIIVVNREGAGGTIAVTELAGMEPDGYTIGSLAIGLFTTQPVMREVQYTLDDFDGVIGLSYEPVMMVTHTDNPWNTIPELVDYAGSHTVKYGYPGNGSLTHLPQAAFFTMAGVEADGVSFTGGGPTMTALVGRHIDVAAGHPSEWWTLVEEGELKPLGVFSPERDEREGLAQIPTFTENGFDIDMSVWKFIVVPDGTPQEVIDKLHDAFLGMMNEPEFVEFSERLFLKMNPYDGEDVIDRIRTEAEFTYGVLDTLGFTNN